MDGMARDRFNTIANSIYEEARKKNRDMQVSKESYDFILDYGMLLGEEFSSVCESVQDAAEGGPLESKSFSREQVCGYLEYYQTICAFWELCGTGIPAIEKLARDMDQVFISKIDPRA